MLPEEAPTATHLLGLGIGLGSGLGVGLDPTLTLTCLRLTGLRMVVVGGAARLVDARGPTGWQCLRATRLCVALLCGALLLLAAEGALRRLGMNQPTTIPTRSAM